MKRVLVFTSHEHEQATARGNVHNPVTTDGYTVGDADETAIAKLQAAGLMVQELPAIPLKEDRGFEFYEPDELTIPGYYLVWLLPPVVPDCHRTIEGIGARLVERHDDWYLFYVTDLVQLNALRAMPWAKAVRPYDKAETIKPMLAANILTARWELVLHPYADRAALETWLAAEGIRVVASSAYKLRIEASEKVARRCGEFVEVAEVVPWVPPKLQLDRARSLIRGEPPPSMATGAFVTGKGVVVGIADSGLDVAHPAFAGAAIQVIARGRAGDGSDPHGHGTHVTGTIGGRPSGALAHLGGIAPDVQLVVQSVLDATGELGGLGDDLTDLLDEAYKKEVRIHNDSWGANVGAAYTTSSLEIDRFVWEHPDMLVVIAAGNAGTCLDPAPPNKRRTAAGWVDWYSLGAPGTSKNALVVGASRSDRTMGGWSRLSHRDLWPNRFPAGSVAEETVSGNQEALAGFSSRGLCDDQRIKPDVVAPGTDIAAPRASTAPSFHFAGMVPGTQRSFAYMSGTSMATPIVTGTAALIREYLQRDRACPKPSAALLKAILINGARPLTSAQARGDTSLEGVPNPHQGFGCIDLVRSIPLDGSFRLAFHDNWQDSAKAFSKLGSNRRRFQFTTDAPAPLRITLAYTDYWWRSLQNNLDIIVECSPPPPLPPLAKMYGNQNLSVLVKMPDSTNNVETVKLDDAPAGTWIVSVIATNLLHDGQHFALAVAGSLSSDSLKEI